jgi:hypothetical protein
MFPTAFVTAQPQPISRDLPVDVEVVSDLPYASHRDHELLFDLYHPAGNTSALPAIVAISGSGWLQGDKEGFGPIAAALAAEGSSQSASNTARPWNENFPQPFSTPRRPYAGCAPTPVNTTSTR